MKILQPVITERFLAIERHGDSWEDKPNDFLQWLIDAADNEHRNVLDLTQRMLVINLAAIHTTSFVRSCFIEMPFCSI
jgi:hypothetical protein